MRFFLAVVVLLVLGSGLTPGGPQIARAQEPETPAAENTPALPKRSLKLPSAADDLIVGGSGKYLIAHLSSVQQLAIVDVAEAKAVKFLPLPAGKILFTAGAEKLFIIVVDQSVIQRWSLTSFEREVSAPLPSEVTPGSLTMGHAAQGPLLVGGGGGIPGRGGFGLLNPKTLKLLPAAPATTGRGFEADANCVVRASANGRVFTSWRTQVSPSGFYTLLTAGQPETFYEHNTFGLLSPSADGERIYTSRGIYSNKTRLIKSLTGNGQVGNETLLPSVTGNYYLRVTPPGYFQGFELAPTTGIGVHLAGDTTPIVTFKDILPPRTERRPPSNDFGRNRLQPDKRLIFFPELSSLTVLAESNDAIDIFQLDLDKKLEESGTDFLFVNSSPPTAAEPGKRFEYEVNVKSKRGSVKTTLSSGPKGMQVSPEGKVTWAVPRGESQPVDVILSIADASGQEIFHSFRLSLGDDEPSTRSPLPPGMRNPQVTKQSAPSQGRFPGTNNSTANKKADPAGGRSPISQPPATKVASAATKKSLAEPAASSSAAISSDASVGRLPALTPAKINGDKMTLKLPAAAEAMEVGGGGRYWIAHLKTLRKLAVIDLCEAKIAGYIAADDNQVKFTAGAEKLVLALGDKSIIGRWSLETRQPELTVPADAGLFLVAMGSASSGPVLALSGSDNRSMQSHFLDLKTLKPIDTLPPRIGFSERLGMSRTRVSADGRIFCLPSSMSLALIMVTDGKAQVLTGDRPQAGNMQFGFGTPSPDGQVIYCGLNRFSTQLRPLGNNAGDRPRQGTIVPATQGPFYLSIPQEWPPLGIDRAPPKVSVHMEGGDGSPLVTLSGISIGSGNDLTGGFQAANAMPLDKRIVFVPDAKVIATLNAAFDEIELHRFDLEETLEASGIDYLLVTSRPPSAVKAGAELKYQLEVKAKKGGPKYRLESGPEGMTLSDEGLLSWQSPADAEGDTTQTIIAVVTDAAGQETFHSFPLTLHGMPRPKEAPALSQPVAAAATPPASTAEPDPFGASVANKSSKLVGQMHTWTDASTGRTLEATFLGLSDNKVKVRNKNGGEVSISLDRLSREDLIWLLGGYQATP